MPCLDPCPLQQIVQNRVPKLHFNPLQSGGGSSATNPAKKENHNVVTIFFHLFFCFSTLNQIQNYECHLLKHKRKKIIKHDNLYFHGT